MYIKNIKMLQTNNIDTGKLSVRVNSAIGALPIENAKIQISYTGDPDEVIEEIQTNNNGISDTIELNSPPLEYSMSPNQNQPYAEYTYKISAENYEPVIISGSQILPNITAIQNVILSPTAINTNQNDRFVIGPHTLYGDYPPKIAEDEIKPIDESGEIVLSRVVIPEYIIVHDGPPSDSSAQNHYVKYKDYIKNVASCEVYATWSRNTLTANILAIMSFTLNRVYTEWYRNRGYNFTITSSTAYDHKWINGKNTYDNISQIVDEIFANYLSRPNVEQPILTQYCDGKQVQCPGWMTQWGSKYLGDEGYTPIKSYVIFMVIAFI